MKQPWPWYSATRSGGGWFVKLNGVHHPLGKHPLGTTKPAKKNGKWNPPSEILAEFYAVMSVKDTASKEDYTVETICALYLEELDLKQAEPERENAWISGRTGPRQRRAAGVDYVVRASSGRAFRGRAVAAIPKHPDFGFVRPGV